MRSPVAWWNDPWRPPRVLVAITVGYLAWSLLPVLIAVMFSFNAGRSRTDWQGFSFRWYWGDQTLSVWHDATLHTALLQTLKLGVIATVITVPLGVLFAIGIDRWRGRLPAGANFLMLISFVLPEVLLAVALLFVITTLVLPFSSAPPRRSSGWSPSRCPTRRCWCGPGWPPSGRNTRKPQWISVRRRSARCAGSSCRC